MLYEDGTAALRDAEGKEASLGIDDPVRWAVSLLSKGAHRFWRAALILSVIALLGLSALLLSGGRLPLGPIVAGAGLSALASAAVWAFARLIGPAFDSAVDREVMLILRDGAWIGIRNSLAVAVAALAILFLTNASARRRDLHSFSPQPPAEG